MVRKFLQSGSKALPYVACLVPLVELFFRPRKDDVTPTILELKNHVDTLHVSMGDATAAVEELQLRQDRLERQCKEITGAIEALAHEQADLIEQVRTMAGWLRNTALAALVLLTLFLVLKGIQIIQAIGH